MGTKSVNDERPAFYARPGSIRGDLIALLHPPYTAWHLAYVAIGAALAPTLDWTLLAGTLAAFFLGTGVGAHALDEWHDRHWIEKVDTQHLVPSLRDTGHLCDAQRRGITGQDGM